LGVIRSWVIADAGATRETARWFGRALLGCAFAILAVRQALFVNAHAVNILYWDQWDFYQPLFQGQGWWATFARQHGPHREGLGLIVTRLLADLSGWNSRWEAFAVLAIMASAAGLGVLLAEHCGMRGRLLLLAGVPLLFFNAHEYEIYVGAVNLSYAAVPLALLMAYCLSWFVRGTAGRMAAISVLSFLLIFTGFGLFVGLLTPLLLVTEAVQSWRSGERRHCAMALAALACSAAAWAAFAHGYTFQPAVAGFRFPYERPFQYLVFAARMLGHFFGTPLQSVQELITGSAVALALVAIAAWNGWRCLSAGVARSPRSAVLFCLAAFALLFCLNCAVGRVFTSAIAPYSSRYVALMVPAGMALLLQLGGLVRARYAWLALLYTLLLVPSTAFLRDYEASGANWYSDGRRAWKEEYLRTRDEAGAARAAHFPIYPAPLGERLKFLEDRNLNLFHDSPHP